MCVYVFTKTTVPSMYNFTVRFLDGGQPSTIGPLYVLGSTYVIADDFLKQIMKYYKYMDDVFIYTQLNSIQYICLAIVINTYESKSLVSFFSKCITPVVGD